MDERFVGHFGQQAIARKLFARAPERQFGFIAAGYTTLVCYMLYAFAHYTFMNRIAEEQFPGIKIYASGILAALTLAFLLSGFSLLFTYQYAIVRYCIGVATVLIIIVKRKQVMAGIRALLQMRKEQ